MKYQIPRVILQNPARFFFFTPARHTYRYKGYLSSIAQTELKHAGNDVIRSSGCWIIKSREGL